MQVYSISLLVKNHIKPWMFMHTRIFVNIFKEMKRDLSRDEYRFKLERNNYVLPTFIEEHSFVVILIVFFWNRYCNFLRNISRSDRKVKDIGSERFIPKYCLISEVSHTQMLILLVISRRLYLLHR